jgi:hypothetical protein
MGSLPGPLWVDVTELVSDALGDVAKGRVISIPARRYQVLMFAARHAPRSVIRAVSKRLNSNRH